MYHVSLCSTLPYRKYKDVYAVFVDLEKGFDRMDWKNFMRILKKIGVDWKERRLLSNLYLKQRIKVKIGKEMVEIRELEGRTARMSSITYTLQHLLGSLMKNCFPNSGGVNIGGRRIKCIRFADDMALLAEDERMLKNMLMELNERCEDSGMKINISKTKAMVIG